MKVTRRQLAPLVLGTAATAAHSFAQAPANLLQKARDEKRATADELAKFPLEILVEPAFQFKA